MIGYEETASLSIGFYQDVAKILKESSKKYGRHLSADEAQDIIQKIVDLASDLAPKLYATCKVCGGTEGKHHLSCTVWKENKNGT